MFYITKVLKHFIVFCLLGSNIWETQVDIAICYGLNCLEFDSREMQGYSCIQNNPYWLWSPPSFQFSGYHFSFPGYSSPDVKLTTHLHLAPMLRINGAMPPLPNSFMAWKGKTCLFYFQEPTLCSINMMVVINLRVSSSICK